MVGLPSGGALRQILTGYSVRPTDSTRSSTRFIPQLPAFAEDQGLRGVPGRAVQDERRINSAPRSKMEKGSATPPSAVRASAKDFTANRSLPGASLKSPRTPSRPARDRRDRHRPPHRHLRCPIAALNLIRSSARAQALAHPRPGGARIIGAPGPQTSIANGGMGQLCGCPGAGLPRQLLRSRCCHPGDNIAPVLAWPSNAALGAGPHSWHCDSVRDPNRLGARHTAWQLQIDHMRI